ncbi:hypothetical protein PHYSODRAFT_315284 [Phytophthora sojae]|uniref:Uncharacterized protein n=1 Tax=Phytophthora sojae (strain P6497) TaxID=1094619 RepID=G4ZH00_PHYSP|nr:hypothetical protein PHYSODRAFT_315284 [Phytophthora sojae]EGZ18625.1 hypothetical protein PHYSODRAFT_315284 [Phytophthora sojae]|eukprot:XP_009527683.1 hypothetical protein PHYSODRAFT_315284 [Phytophthora sojae]
MAAAKGNHVEIMALLGTKVDLRRRDGCSALHLAVASQRPKAAKLQLGFDADASFANNDGVMPMKLLLRVAPQSIRAVSQNGANVLAIAAQANGNTALTIAAESGQVEAVGTLLSHSARGNTSEFPEVAPLAAAAQHGHVEVIQVLPGAVYRAVYSGQLEAARALVEASLGANVNKRNQSGWTPLMAAAHRNFAQIMELLLERGASLTLKTKDGRTALHIAAQEGHTEAGISVR